MKRWGEMGGWRGRRKGEPTMKGQVCGDSWRGKEMTERARRKSGYYNGMQRMRV